ncbi:helicase protein [Dictyocaulus viviparus]|uniref:Helicase protein n=1 Tax=Dictyocaulus viviparus TaxID=29172 RepID=A0A0D8XLZ5_DICVI|nr:helicase protein [Dictyocaulus viviparus]
METMCDHFANIIGVQHNNALKIVLCTKRKLSLEFPVKQFTLKREDQSLPNIKQYLVECPGRDAKYQAVVELYSGLTIASCVIFTHTRRSASWLAERMTEKGHLVGVLHGEMSVEERAESIQRFKDGDFKVLITTNVCARGIDVSQVTIVINYDPPLLYETPSEPDYDTYLHRIGRTGRFGKAGIAINFVDSRETLLVIKKIEAFFVEQVFIPVRVFCTMLRIPEYTVQFI